MVVLSTDSLDLAGSERKKHASIKLCLKGHKQRLQIVRERVKSL